MSKTTTKKQEASLGTLDVSQHRPSAKIGTTDLHIEEIPNEKPADLPAVITVEQRAKNEVARFDVAREVIAAKKEEYKGLKIAGVDDKEGEKKVTAAWQWFRGKRLAVTKKKDEIKSDYLVITRAVDQEHNELKDLLLEGENEFGNELDRIETLRTEAKQAAERSAQLKLQGRVASLLENGMSFTGSFYTIGETISADVVTLKDLPDDQFAALLLKVQTENEKIQQAAAEKSRLQKEENDKVEAQRLKNQEDQAELNRKNEELQKKLDKLKEAQRKIRAQRLEAIGMTYTASDFTFRYKTTDHGVALLDGKVVDESEDVDFEAEVGILETKIADMKAAQLVTDKEKKDADDLKEANRLKALKDKETKDQRTALRQMQVQGIGLTFIQGTGWYGRESKYPHIHSGVSVTPSEIEELEPEKWDDLIFFRTAKIVELIAVEVTETERLEKEAESERLAGLTDMEALKEFAIKFKALVPSLPNVKAKKVKPSQLSLSVGRIRNKLQEIERELDTATAE